jgi:SAM-dependent methyltransferase
MDISTEWFETWFDTKYYHSLYKHRDENEAAYFIQRLLDEIELPEHSQVLDLACGKGRHSITLFDAGYRVVGLDLSKNSIDHLKDKEREGLEFYEWDMRERFRASHFDCVFNLFTSFGYFDSMEDNLRVIDAVEYGLKKNGLLVLDYLNPDSISSQKEEIQEKDIDGYSFKTRKQIKNNKIVKDILVKDGDKELRFFESVQLLGLDDFKAMFKQSGLKLEKVFGDYKLGSYEPESSPRLIMIARKP